MATVGLMILLVIRWLVGGVYQVFFAESVAANKPQSERVTADLSEVKGASKPALPPADEDAAIPVDAFASRKAKLVQPPSVTEETTGLLGKQ
jgi:hypothetical protein